MKLKIPLSCKDLDLTDKQKVLANLMLLIAWEDRKDDWAKTEYYFNKADIGRLVNTQSINTSELTNAFVIGRLNEHTISIRFINAAKNGLNHPDYYVDRITDEKAVLLHMFIMGRFSNPCNLFGEAKLHTKQQVRSNPYAVHYSRDKINS